jgi:hypothetical protein
MPRIECVRRLRKSTLTSVNVGIRDLHRTICTGRVLVYGRYVECWSYQPTFPRHVTVTTAFSPGGISFDSFASQENAGLWISSYSVSYASNTESSLSARACCAGAMVLSLNVRRTESIGSVETFSSVIRIVDLYQELSVSALVIICPISRLSIVEHDGSMRQGRPPYS